MLNGKTYPNRQSRPHIVASVEREPPHNFDAERALIGAVLVDKDVYAKVRGRIDVEHFFGEPHRRIWIRISMQIDAGSPADPRLMTDLTVEERRYAGQLVAEATTTINAPHYADIVRDLAVRRRILDLAKRLTSDAHDNELAASAITRATSAEVEMLRADAQRGTSDPFVARRVADIEAVRIRWLWHSRFPLGKVSIIAGDPGVGKSQLSCAFAAAVTTGGQWPDDSHAPFGSAIFICCEDDAGDTLRPRLEAAGADARRVLILDSTVDDNGVHRHFNVAQGIDGLSALVKQIGDVQLVVIDPISAYMGRADSHVAADVRDALAPIQAMAAELGPAVLLISHLNKSATGGAMSRVSGSGAFVAVARAAWLVGADPGDETKRRRILAPLKNNLGDGRTGFAYQIEPRLVGDIPTSMVVFEPGTVTTSADELLQSASKSIDTSARGEAKEFLRRELEDGPKPSRDIDAAARDAGISEASLRRARKDLGVLPKKGSGGWSQQLPGQRDASQGVHGDQGEHPDHDG